MLCQKGTAKDLERVGWVGETKFDGTRAFLIKNKDSFLIQNRRGVNYTHRLPEIAEEALAIDASYIIDGELCWFNAEGISEFTPTQRRCSTQDIGKIWYLKNKYPLNFMAFDILELYGDNLRNQPYLFRKRVLEGFLYESGLKNIRYTKHTEFAEQLFKDTVKRGGEGIILKRVNSIYQEGVRSYDWLKLRPEYFDDDESHKATCQVVGYTQGKNRRSNYFGSLVLTQNGAYVGKVGSGFSDHELAEITAHLKGCARTPSPFQIDEPYTAVKTNLKVLVRFQQRTPNGVFRFPSFLKVME